LSLKLNFFWTHKTTLSIRNIQNQRKFSSLLFKI